jgi:hypothetical protein
MTFNVHRKLSLAGLKATISNWARAAARHGHGSAQRQPYPGAYALLVGIHRD